MATVSTIAAVKRALLDEIQTLAIASATAAAPTYVQTEYARPAIDKLRREVVYFDAEMRTQEDTEYRLNSGRRKRFNLWDLDIVVSTEILADPELAEARNFAIVAAIEGFLADNPSPVSWPNAPVASGALWVRVVGYEVDHEDTQEGFRLVETNINLEVKEHLV